MNPASPDYSWWVDSESGEDIKQKQNSDFQVFPELLNQLSFFVCLSW